MIKDEKYHRQLATAINQKALLSFALHTCTRILKTIWLN